MILRSDILSNGITKLILSLKRIKHVGNATIIKAFNKINTNQINDNFNFIKKLNINEINKLINAGILTKSQWDRLVDWAGLYIKKAINNDVYIINFLSSKYPRNLKLISTKRYPVILYVKGNLNILNSKSVAIIGTRHPSRFGISLAKKYASYFARNGYIDIGGLALGIDSSAHRATLNAGGKVIAILAAGLDQPISPKSNTNLAQRILNYGGALVSEYPLGTRVHPRNYVARDKWQSGMADGVIAVEAGMHSGTQHTMKDAIYQKRLLGSPDYKQYKLIYNNLNKPVNELPASPGTQMFIRQGISNPLCSKHSVINFRNSVLKDREKRLSKDKFQSISPNVKDVNKKDIISNVAKQTGFTKKDTSLVFNKIISTIQDSLAEDRNVRLTGFGSFRVNHYNAHQGRNPQNGKVIAIPSYNIASFRSGAKLKRSINK